LVVDTGLDSQQIAVLNYVFSALISLLFNFLRKYGVKRAIYIGIMPMDYELVGDSQAR
jgi:hypothetical protein